MDGPDNAADDVMIADTATPTTLSSLFTSSSRYEERVKIYKESISADDVEEKGEVKRDERDDLKDESEDLTQIVEEMEEPPPPPPPSSSSSSSYSVSSSSFAAAPVFTSSPLSSSRPSATITTTSGSSSSTVTSQASSINSRNIFDKLGSSLRRVGLSLGLEKNFKNMTVDDIDKATTVSGAVAALKLVNERVLGGVRVIAYEGNESLVLACLHCLIRVMSSPTHGKSVGISLLSSILSPLTCHTDVIWRGMHVIFLLSSEQSNCDKMGESGYCELCVAILTAYISASSNREDKGDNYGQLVDCLKAIKSLCESEKNQRRFLALGVCEQILVALHRFNGRTGMYRGVQYTGAYSPSVVEWCCRTLYNIAYDNAAVQTQFCSLSCCFELLELLKDSSDLLTKSPALPNNAVSEWAVRALGALCQQHEANKAAFALAGGCQTIINMFLSSSSKSLNMTEALLTCIANTSFPDVTNQTSYCATSGVFQALLEVLSSSLLATQEELKNDRTGKVGTLSHTRTNTVEQLGCIEASLKAIRNLCQDNQEAVTIAFSINLHSTVLECVSDLGLTFQGTAFARHIHSAAEWSLFALCSLVDTAPRLRLLAAGGGCLIISEVLKKQASNATVAQWTCHAMRKLASLPDTAQLLEEAGICHGLALALSRHAGDEEVVEELCLATAALCISYDKVRCSLSAVNFCEYLHGAAKKHLERERVMQAIMPTIAALLGGSVRDSVTAKLGSIGICKVVGRAMKLYSAFPVTAIACLQCVVVLGTGSEYAKSFGAGDVCASLELAVSSGFNDPVCASLFLQAVASLATYEPNVKRFGSTGVLKWIMSVMSHYMDSEDLAATACRALSDLAVDSDCGDKLCSLRAAELLVLVLSGHRKSVLVSAWCCLAIGRLAGTTLRLSQRLGEEGVCSALAEVLRTHSDSELVCKHACEAIAGLAIASKNNRIKLGKEGICESLLSAIRSHEQSEVVTAVGLTAIAAMVDDCNLNHTAMVEAGVSTVIVAALHRFTTHIDVVMLSSASLDPSTQAVESACLSLARLLAQPIGRESFQRTVAEEGGCISLTAALDAHVASASVVQYALEAMALLATDSDDNALVFVAIAAAEAVCRAVNIHISSDAISHAGATALIAFKNPNGVLCSETVCKLVPIILHRHKSIDRVVEATCRLIYSLCKGFSRNAENEMNRRALGLNNACEEVVAALERHTSNEASLLIASSSSRAGAALAVQWACLAIYVLGHENPEHQERFGRCGACASVGRAVSSSNNGFAYSEAAAYAACQAICALARNNTKHQIALGNAGACSSVIEALHQHPASVGIARWGLLAVSVLAENSETNSSRFGDSGATNIIPLTLHTHQTSAAVALSGCAAIKSIANVSLAFTAELGQYGACECAIAALNLHMSESKVVAEGLRAIASLARYLGNASWFGPARAAEAIMQAVTTHSGDNAVVTSAYSAVERLCIDTYMSERLAVLVLSQASCICDSVLTLTVCRAVSRLIKGGSMQAKLNLCFLGLCKVLVSCLDLYSKTSSAVVTECTRALVYLLKNVSDDVDDVMTYFSVSRLGVAPAVLVSRPLDAASLQRELGDMHLPKILGHTFEALLGTADPTTGLSLDPPPQRSSKDFKDLLDLRSSRSCCLLRFLCSLVHFLARDSAVQQQQLQEAHLGMRVVSVLEIALTSIGQASAETEREAIMHVLLAAINALSSLASGSSASAATNRRYLGRLYASEAVCVVLGRVLSAGADLRCTAAAAAFLYQRGRAKVFSIGGGEREGVAGLNGLIHQLIHACLRASTNLLQGCNENRSRFSQSGLAELLLAVLSESRLINAVSSVSLKIDRELKVIEYFDNSLVELSLLSLHAISSEPVGRKKLVEYAAVAARTVIAIAHSKDEANGLVMFLCSSIISQLCCDGEEACQSAFGVAGAAQVLVTCLHKLCAFWFILSLQQDQTTSSSSATTVTSSSVDGAAAGAATTITSGNVLGTKKLSRRQSFMNSVSSVIGSQRSSSDASLSSPMSSSSSSLFSPFASTFTLDSSHALAEEVCKAILEMLNCSSSSSTSSSSSISSSLQLHPSLSPSLNQNDDRRHDANLLRFKSLISETCSNPLYAGRDVLQGGRDVLSCTIAHFSRLSQEEESGAAQLARRALEVIAPQVPLLMAQMNRVGLGTSSLPASAPQA